MSEVVEFIPCEDCGSEDNRAVYLNIDEDLGVTWYTSFCFGECYEQKGDPYQGKEAPDIESSTRNYSEELDEVKLCKQFLPTTFRGMPKEAFITWKLKLLLSEFDGKTPYAVGFPMSSDLALVGYKCRPLKSKTFFNKGNLKGADLFGLVRALRFDDTTLWVTEGEYDAIALNYCMYTVTGRNYPVVSLTSGGGSLKSNLKNCRNHLTKYKEIRFVLDNDEVGIKAELQAKELLGNRARIIPKPKGCKDANDAVKCGLTERMGELALINYE